MIGGTSGGGVGATKTLWIVGKSGGSGLGAMAPGTGGNWRGMGTGGSVGRRAPPARST